LRNCVAFITGRKSYADKLKGDEYELVMLPLKPFEKAITAKDYRLELSQELKLHDWLWLIAFSIICVCNGWFLRVSSEPLVIVICFAIFPLIYMVYEVSDNTQVLSLLVVISWGILAFTIVNLDLPSLSLVAIILYSINIVFFGFVLIDVLSDSGLFLLLFVIAITVLLFIITNWETVLRLVWFCNLMVTASNASTRLNRFFHSFSTAMMILTGAAALSLSLGWLLAGVKLPTF
jgi:hypothetical protein